MLDEVIDDEILDLLFRPPDDHLAEGLRGHADLTGQHRGTGQGLGAVPQIDAAQDMQGVGRGESAFVGLLRSFQLFEIPAEGDAAEAGGPTDLLRGGLGPGCGERPSSASAAALSAS